MAQLANTSIATATKEPANGAGGCVVIDMKAPLRVAAGRVCAADGADASLFDEHSGIGAVWHAEPDFEGNVGFLLRVLACPFEIVGRVSFRIGAAFGGHARIRADFATGLVPVSGRFVQVEIIQRLHLFANRAGLFCARCVGRWLGMLRTPCTMPVGFRADLAPAGKPVTMASVLVKFVARLSLAARRAKLRFHSRSPFLPIVSVGLV